MAKQLVHVSHLHYYLKAGMRKRRDHMGKACMMHKKSVKAR